MKVLGHDDILNAKDILVEPLEVPEWGGIVYVKTLTGEERDKIETAVIQVSPSTGRVSGARMEKLRSLVAFYGLCDESGTRLFTQEKDLNALTKKSSAALDRVVAKIQALAGMTPGDVENLAGELKNDQLADLPLDSVPS